MPSITETPPVRGIVFDLDGVFLPFWPRAAEDVPVLFEKLGRPDIAAHLRQPRYRNAFRVALMDLRGWLAIQEVTAAICADHRLPPPPHTEAMWAEFWTLDRRNGPLPLLPGSIEALRAIRAMRGRNSTPFVGLVTNRSYESARFHFDATPEVWELFDVMQFFHAEETNRVADRRRIVEDRRGFSIFVHNAEKPDARSFDPLLSWMRARGFLNQRGLLLFVGDSPSDYKASRNITAALRKKDIPLVIHFVPLCSGPVQTPAGWLRALSGEGVFSLGPIFQDIAETAPWIMSVCQRMIPITV